MQDLLKVLRPQQWVKNVLVFAGIIFAQHLYNLLELAYVALAFIIFCLLSSVGYIINDIIDFEKDRVHPYKCSRPIASGRLRKNRAWILTYTLFFISLFFCLTLSTKTQNPLFWLICLGYLGLNIFYSLGLKNFVIIDVLVLSLFYVLRVVAGCVVILVRISPWLILCTLLLALFLGLCKRRHELVLLGDLSGNFREVLPKYSPQLLDQMIAVTTAATIMAYSLYTFTAHQPIAGELELRPLMLTIPFVIYGLFRYLYLAYRRDIAGAPELMFKDKPMVMNLLLWVSLVLYLVSRQKL